MSELSQLEGFEELVPQVAEADKSEDGLTMPAR